MPQRRSSLYFFGSSKIYLHDSILEMVILVILVNHFNQNNHYIHYHRGGREIHVGGEGFAVFESPGAIRVINVLGGLG